ncbi:LacI family DNA-binding transcriptional regulator [Paenibacillus chibensis]|uniref:LacI family DNA-binding transcriptional regulator n=1 Tax=Paenibacillus chibensis TaxID=59846 RepID=A0ABU6PYT9_9BACL|nr:LacI family DNA-binding transcriptional regulator [Paenibacillus chibensis]
MAKKITMQQIADHLGVSKFVVSKALSGKGGVNETTKERVIQAASQLGYFSQKNAYIRSPKAERPASKSGGKQSVIVLMPNIRFQTKESLYWGKIVEGISGSLEDMGLGMVIISEQSVDNFVHILNPDGILGLIGVGQISTPLLLEVHRLGMPIVLVDMEDPLIPSDTVFVNNMDAMAKLTNYLIGIGHRRLQFIGNDRFSRSFRDRHAGFRITLEEHGLNAPAQDGLALQLQELEKGDIETEVKGWLSRKLKAKAMPTALVCANDSIAVTVVQVLNELGLKVPSEVSVTGFDNIEDAMQNAVRLTTVHVPKEAMGRRAVQKLLERIERPLEPMEKILLAGDIVYRDSSGAAADSLGEGE